MSSQLSVARVNGRLHSDLKGIVEQALSIRQGYATRPVGFIERKLPDFEELEEILQLSSEMGHWANFGPVSSLLESALERHLNVHPARTVMMCSSGTAALLTLVASKNYRAGRRLRWVVSAYGFRSTSLGPLADALVLDCDERGMLDLDALARLDPDTWDGIVLTNVFGLNPDVRSYIELCRNCGKELILDNAGLLNGYSRHDLSACVDEVLSFHQTKPWGMGEGGCAILAKDDAAVFRQLTNLGKGMNQTAREGASNSKISDFSCALILQRLLQAAKWSSLYRKQARRVLRIALAVGLRPLAPLDLTSLTPPHLPILAMDPVAEADLENETLRMHKYYRPLSDSAPKAWAIYERIVNIPCHPDMAVLKDDEIRHCLEGIASERRRAHTTRTR